MDDLLQEEGWLDCYTKKDGWTVVQRRLDGLLYKDCWMDCYTKKVR